MAPSFVRMREGRNKWGVRNRKSNVFFGSPCLYTCLHLLIGCREQSKGRADMIHVELRTTERNYHQQCFTTCKSCLEEVPQHHVTWHVTEYKSVRFMYMGTNVNLLMSLIPTVFPAYTMILSPNKTCCRQGSSSDGWQADNVQDSHNLP